MSDFVDEHNSFLALSDAEHDSIESTDSKYAQGRILTGPGTDSSCKWSGRSRLLRLTILRKRVEAYLGL